MNNYATQDFQGTDRFSIQRRLGAGGTGVVYCAHDRERDEVVALKTLRNVDGTTIYRFKREFRLLAELELPNIVRLYELFSNDNHWFFTMQYVEGVDYLRFVRTGLRKPSTEHGDAISDENGSTARFRATERAPIQDEARESDLDQPVQYEGLEAGGFQRLRQTFSQLVTAVHALHGAGIVHRDIKPSNVFVDGAGQVVLLDFGLAREVERKASVTTTHQIVGTVLYMSPEQAAGDELTPASDWYSVGVMLFEALTGTAPVRGRALDIIVGKQSFEPSPPSQFVPNVPRELDLLCAELLQRDPASRPRGEKILERLSTYFDSASMQQDRHASPMSELPFVGREQETAKLNEAFNAIKAGRTEIALVHGNSGVGKSELLNQFLDSLDNKPDTVVLAGRCYERESVAYKALDSLIDSLTRYLCGVSSGEADALMPRDVWALARLFPVLNRMDAVANAPRRIAEIPDHQELRRRAFGALREMLVRLGDRKRLVLSVDDLQWSDLDSMVLMKDLLQPPDPPILLFIAGYRREEEDSSPALQAWLEAHQSIACDIPVEALTLEDARRLARVLLERSNSGCDEGQAESIAQESRGIPYFIDVLVRRAETLPIDSSAMSQVTLDEALWQRVMRLAAAERRILEAACIAASPISKHEVADAAELSAGLWNALDSLRNQRLIRAVGSHASDLIETYHDRIRETVVAHLTAEEVKARHTRLALAFERSDRSIDPAILAVHFLGAEREDKAYLYYLRAAERASDSLAFDNAVNFYQLAFELAHRAGKPSRDIRRKLADALANAGRGREAATEYFSAAEDANAAETLELRRLAAMHSLMSGHIDEGLEVMASVLPAIGMKLPPTTIAAVRSLLWQRAKLRIRGFKFRERDRSQVSAQDLTRLEVCWSTGAALSIVDPLRGAVFQAHALLLSLRTGQADWVAKTVAFEAGLSALRGRVAEVRCKHLSDHAERLANRLSNPNVTGTVVLMRGVAAFLTGHFNDARILSDRAESILRNECTGVAWELTSAQSFGLWSLFYLGQVGELNRRLPVLLKEAKERGNLYALSNFGTFASPMERLAADDPAQAEQALDEAMRHWSRRGFHVQHLNDFYGRLQVEIYRGDGTAAWDIANQTWPGLKRSRLLQAQHSRIACEHIRARSALAAAANSANRESLVRVAERTSRKLERERLTWAIALACAIRAGIASLRKDPQRAIELLTRAATQFDEVQMELYAQSARRQLGRLQGGAQGAQLVSEADQWMIGQGIVNPSRMADLHLPGIGAPNNA